MTDEPHPSLFSRLKRPILLAVLGLITVGTGAGVGLWLNPRTPDTPEGDHSTGKEHPIRRVGEQPVEEDRQFVSLLSDSEVDAAPMPATWNEMASETDRIANHVATADNALRIGDFAKAISLYRFLLPYTDGAYEAAIRYRLALASECSGADDEALLQYQAIAQKFSRSNWPDLAELGRVRCLANSSQSTPLDAVVYRNLILDNTALTPPIRSEVLHAAARGLCGLLLDERRTSILEPDTLLLAGWSVDPNTELQQLTELLKASPVQPGTPAFERLQKLDDDPENIYFKIHTHQTSLKTLFDGLAQRAELRIIRTPAAEEALKSRKQEIHAEDVSMSLLLDGLCVPFGLTWHREDGAIIVSTTAERSEQANAEFFLARIERILGVALLEAADSPQSGHTRIAHGCLLFETGRPADAAHIFARQLQSGTNRAVDIEAAFDLGKCYQALGQAAEAEAAWYRCVDAGGKDRITRTAAYICLSRIQLEDGRFQRAATSLVTALALARGTVLEQQAAALLGSAYLLTGNAPAANSIMFDHQDSMKSAEIRQAVAFAGALARYRAAGLSDRQEIEARDVVATLSHFDPATAFGAHWYVLVAQACEELGLADRALRTYIDAVQYLNEGGLRQTTMLELAQQYRNNERLTDAETILQAVSSGKPGPQADEADIGKVELELRRGNAQAAIDLGHQIALNTTGEVTRRRALRLMGKAFEKLHDHESAVYCFAGMLPRKLTSQAVRPAVHEGLK